MKEKLETRNSKLKVLLIEDNPGDARLIREMLGETGGDRFDIKCADSLSTGLKYLAEGSGEPDETSADLNSYQSSMVNRQSKIPFDVILLDLSLPDSQGLDTVIKMHDEEPRLAIIVLTGTDDESLGFRAVQQGAQDYLVKGQINSQLLGRAIRYAVERSHLVDRLERARQREREERELRTFAQISRAPQTAVTARLFGEAPLHEALPDVFNDLSRKYSDLMDRVLEQRAYKVEHNMSENIRSMAEEMGFLKAGPRDVVEMHTMVLKKKTSRAASQKAQAYMEEGRLMVLELMGCLVSFYRNYSLGH
jgi:CheY-like chemotaxis protein